MLLSFSSSLSHHLTLFPTSSKHQQHSRTIQMALCTALCKAWGVFFSPFLKKIYCYSVVIHVLILRSEVDYNKTTRQGVRKLTLQRDSMGVGARNRFLANSVSAAPGKEESNMLNEILNPPLGGSELWLCSRTSGTALVKLQDFSERQTVSTTNWKYNSYLVRLQ